MTRKSQQRHVIGFNLVSNAQDSITRAVGLLAWKEIANDDSRMKQAIISVAHGVELMLKERLRRVEPALMWENIDKYPKLDARTVTVEKATDDSQKRENPMPTVPLDDKHDATIRPTEKIKPGVYRCELTVGLVGGVSTKSRFIGNGKTAQQARDGHAD